MAKKVLSVEEEKEVNEHVFKIGVMLKARYKKSDDILEVLEEANELWTMIGHYEAPKSEKIRKEVRKRLHKKYGVNIYRFGKETMHMRVTRKALVRMK